MCDKLDGLFNLSATFRYDSDITNIYLMYSNILWEENLDYNDKIHLKSKQGFAAILISHCTDVAQRLDYIEELNKYVPVDIYGGCSSLKCPKNEDCRKYIADRYKFFLAFENSVCNEYITEKFFDTLNYDILPVVLGAGDYSKYAPKSAFINAIDFPAPKQLAEYLAYLNSNQTAYNEYFKWKRYIQKYKNQPEMPFFCELCIRLQLERFTGIEKKQFTNHSKYMGMKENCRGLKVTKVRDLKLFEYIPGMHLVMKNFEW